MRVLVIDGNTEDRRATSLALLAENMSLELTDSGEEGVSLAKLYDFDLITLDLQLPDMTGFEALRQIRRSGIKTPVLILSTMALVTDIVKALDLGADDYLTKPFHDAELIARIHSLARRSKGHAQSVITTGNLALNLDTKTVTVAGDPLRLTGKEYTMLELLSLRKGITLTKDTFLSHLYGGMDEPEAKIVDVFICKIRKKLRAVNGHPIETVWGRGYVLRDPDAGSPSMAAEVGAMIEDAPAGWNSKAFRGAATLDKRGVADKVHGSHGKIGGEVKPASKGVHILIPAT